MIYFDLVVVYVFGYGEFLLEVVWYFYFVFFFVVVSVDGNDVVFVFDVNMVGFEYW